MTAEVVVLNKSAIALAADSKVTIGGARMSKTYDTVNKLFTLSKTHPVGIMIYGNADFMKYPWETIIKLYRQQKAAQCEKSIARWADDFAAYVSKFGSINEADKRENLIEVANAWFAAVLDEAEESATVRGVAPSSDHYKELLKNILEERLLYLDDKELWLQKPQQNAFIMKYGKTIDTITADHVGHFNDKKVVELAEMFISLAIFSKAPSPLSSGVVVAGFGEEEIFPTVVSLECDGYIGDKLKLYNENEIDISRKMSGAMRAFAQGEMVHRFMDGFDPMLARSVFTAFGEVLNDSCIKVMEKYSAKSKQTGKIRAEISAASAKALGQLVENFREYTQKAFSRPIVEMVSLLPKDELANLAESLVALTSLKRRVSHDLETVGGAIDVAIISKSDGFAWVKRKHYFPSDLNPSFNRNYMNGIHKEIDL